MADKKISQMPAVTTINDADLITTVRSSDPAGTKNKKITGIDAITDILETKEYSNLNTTDKTIVGSINEDKLQKEIAFGTGLLVGGEISINVDDTKFDVQAGSGVFVDNYTDPENPTSTTITWSTQTAISVTNIATASGTVLGINDSGTIIQSVVPFTTAQEREIFPIGVLAHLDNATINASCSYNNRVKDVFLQLEDLDNALGSQINVEGNAFSPNGANLKLDRSAGIVHGSGINYDTSKQDPNRKSTGAGVQIEFYMTKRTAGASVFTLTTDLDVVNYDPNGDGTLIAIPSGKFTNHRIVIEPCTDLVFIQYGQFLYDTLKKAVDSAEKEDFIYSEELKSFPTRCFISFLESTSTLNDIEEAKFSTLGRLGSFTLIKTPNYSRFSEAINVIQGMSNESQSITYVNDAGTLYADIESTDGGDIIYNFGEREYTLDCTTGSGVSGRARVALTAGAGADDPEENYVYVTKSGEAAVLNASTTFPTGEFAWLCRVLMPDATTFDSLGAYSSQRYRDTKSHDGRGALSYQREKLRSLGVSYDSGIVPTITITDLTPDTVDFETTSGEVYQLHKQTMPALDSSVEGIFVINHPTPYTHVTDIGQILIDANGDSLNNTSFNFVFVGIKSSADGVDYSHLGLLLPNGSYNYLSLTAALADENNTAVTSVPSELKQTAFLICRVTMKYKNGVWNNVTEDETAVTFFDLRGNPLGATSGGAGTPSVTQFLDTVFRVLDDGDPTKQLAFECSGITTGQTRTLTIPDTTSTIMTSDGFTAMTDLTVDNININGNTISSTDTNGDITLDPNGSGDINLNAQQINIENNMTLAGDLQVNGLDIGTTAVPGQITLSDTFLTVVVTLVCGSGLVIDRDIGVATDQDLIQLADNLVSINGVIDSVTQIIVDNMDINGNTLSSTSGNINITPVGGSNITLDGTVTIDAGVVAGITSLTADDVNIDNININGNTISTISGDLILAPTAASNVLFQWDSPNPQIIDTDHTSNSSALSFIWTDSGGDPEDIWIIGMATLPGFAFAYSSDLTGVGAPVLKAYIDTDGKFGLGGEVAPDSWIEITTDTPTFKFHNSTAEDTDGGRESLISFDGHGSAVGQGTLATIQASHDGGGSDFKGDLIWKTHDGSSLVEGMRLDSTQTLVANAVDVTTTLDVTGAVDFSSTLDVTGNINALSTLNVGDSDGVSQGKIRVEGTDSNNTTGNITNYYSTSDVYPVRQIRNYAHDDMTDGFDCYWDTSGTLRSSSESSNIFFAKSIDDFTIRADKDHAVGNAISGTWAILNFEFSTNQTTFGRAVANTIVLGGSGEITFNSGIGTTGSTSGYQDLFINTTDWEVKRFTSGLFYKENIRPFVDYEKIYDLDVVLFDEKKQDGLNNISGFIAEGFYDKIPDLINWYPVYEENYNDYEDTTTVVRDERVDTKLLNFIEDNVNGESIYKDGEVLYKENIEGVQFRADGYSPIGLIPFMVKAIQIQKTIIDNLESRIATLEVA